MDEHFLVKGLLLATRNTHKAEEIRSILGARFWYRGLDSHPEAPTVIEDGQTFEENAILKSKSLARWLAQTGNPRSEPGGMPSVSMGVLADDSGLEVDTLDGAPGVHSARFAVMDDPGVSGNASDEANNQKLLRLLHGVPEHDRGARFRCVVALTGFDHARDEWVTVTFEGICEGRINRAATGEHGFGYDPLFIPTGFSASFSELGEEIKNRLSHRSQALIRLRDWLTAGR